MPPPTREALKFFAWAYENGGKMAEELDYVPMPDNVVKDVQKHVGERDQGRERQAALRDDQLTTSTTEKAPIRRLFHLSVIAGRHGLRCGRDGRLSWLPRSSSRERLNATVGETTRG